MTSAAAAALEKQKEFCSLGIKCGVSVDTMNKVMTLGITNVDVFVHTRYPKFFSTPVELINVVALLLQATGRNASQNEIDCFCRFCNVCIIVFGKQSDSLAVSATHKDAAIDYSNIPDKDDQAKHTSQTMIMRFKGVYWQYDMLVSEDFLDNKHSHAMTVALMSGEFLSILPDCQKLILLSHKTSDIAKISVGNNTSELSVGKDHEDALTVEAYAEVLDNATKIARGIVVSGCFQIKTTDRGGGNDGYVAGSKTTRHAVTERSALYLTARMTRLCKSTNKPGPVQCCDIFDKVLRKCFDTYVMNKSEHMDAIIKNACDDDSNWKVDDARGADQRTGGQRGRRNDRGGGRGRGRNGGVGQRGGQPGGKSACLQFFVNGNCRYGNSCRFRHDGQGPTKAEKQMHAGKIALNGAGQQGQQSQQYQSPPQGKGGGTPVQQQQQQPNLAQIPAGMPPPMMSPSAPQWRFC